MIELFKINGEQYAAHEKNEILEKTHYIHNNKISAAQLLRSLGEKINVA